MTAIRTGIGRLLTCFGLSAVLATAWAENEQPLELDLKERSTALFADSQTMLHVELRGPRAAAGKLVWRHAMGTRTFSAGELAIKPDEQIAITLRAPVVKDGTSLESQLSLSLVDNTQAVQTTFVKTLWIFP